MNPDAGFWLLPTRGRVTTNLPRFIEAAVAAETTTKVIILVDPDEDLTLYGSLALPLDWEIRVVQSGSSGEAFERARLDLMDDHVEWVGFLSDDLIPETPQWDTKLLAQLGPFNVVSTNDGAHAPKRMNGAVAWSAELVRAVGYVYPEGLKHMFIDDVWEELGRATGNWRCDMDIMVRHAHASWGGQKDATMTRANGYFTADRQVYERWRRGAGYASAVDAIMGLIAKHGGKVEVPDLRGYRVMIATPTGDGTFEGAYQRAYVTTRDAIRQYGGEVYLAEAPYLSDLALARSKLFGHFLRSDATHMFWIDADQGWRLKDFMRLLLSGRPLSAAAGVRKVSPPSFAVNNTDEFGRPLQISHSSLDGMIKVTHVGFAFVCITRSWAERMAQHYADLAYVGADGLEEVAVFNPMVLNRRYLGEDFAACQRWRNMGGEVWVAPEINLEHVGKHLWEGAWIDGLIASSRREQVAA